jgi:long-subunit fatty acid transport protein
MKKIFTLIIVLFTFSNLTNAQAWDGKGDLKINGGIEFYANNPKNDIHDTGMGLLSTIDYGVLDNISVGFGVNYNFDYTNFYFNLRGDYHFQSLLELSSNFDLYAGSDIGLNTYYNNDWDFGVHAGVRFMFTDAIGVFFEVGNRGNAGLTYNF